MAGLRYWSQALTVAFGFAPPAVTSLGSGFVFNDTATTEIYTLSLHDALPIWVSLTVSLRPLSALKPTTPDRVAVPVELPSAVKEPKSTRLNFTQHITSPVVFSLRTVASAVVRWACVQS